jgi:hypothetical protein
MPRDAQCPYCNKLEPSSLNLAFFEDRSVETDRTTCAHQGCYFVRAVHQPVNPATGRAGITDHTFIPRTYHYDSFYCGCRGWD